MKIILDCFNLLGDSLYLIQPARDFAEQNGDVVAIFAHPGLAFEMFAGANFKIPIYSDLTLAQSVHPDATILKLDAGSAGHYAFTHQVNGRQMHISEAYASILGIKLKQVEPNIEWQRLDTVEKDIIAIAPFSRSCTRHSGGTPNKTLDDWKWEHIIRYLRRQDLPVKVIGGPNDRLAVNSVPLDSYVCASNLLELESVLKRCALFVSVDNGLGHIASALNVDTVLLWPKVSSYDFIAPRFGKRTMFISMGTPNEASPAAILCGLRHIARFLLGGIDYEILSEEEQGVDSQPTSTASNVA